MLVIRVTEVKKVSKRENLFEELRTENYPSLVKEHGAISFITPVVFFPVLIDYFSPITFNLCVSFVLR